MTVPTIEFVKSYYDERIAGKIRDFTNYNPRIEAAIQTLAEWAPVQPKRVLEIGCGIGATSWRMARAWPQAEVIGADVSPASIHVARTCFRLDNLKFYEGIIQEGALDGKFDFVVLMDVYEHIAVEDRPVLHSAIKSLLSDESRIFFAFPTPTLQNYGRLHKPTEMQPVDEDVTTADIIRIAEETKTKLLFYRDVGVWRYGDYAHLVLGRYQALAEVTLRKGEAGGIARFKRCIKRLLSWRRDLSFKHYDYLGSDLLRPSQRNVARQFDVSSHERRRLVASWPPSHNFQTKTDQSKTVG